MKFLLFALIAAVAAEPEADPQNIYSTFTPYSGYPLYNPYRFTYSTYHNTYSPLRFFNKREAEADAQYLFSTPYTSNNLYTPYTTYSGAYNNLYTPYTTYSGVYNNLYTPYRYIQKREAEADADLVYKNGNFHTNLANLQKGVHTPYAHQTPVSQVYSVPKLYNTAPYVGQYMYPARPVFQRVFKREAEAEADADAQSFYTPYNLGYSSYYRPYTYGNTYSSLYRPFGSVYGRPYRFF